MPSIYGHALSSWVVIVEKSQNKKKFDAQLKRAAIMAYPFTPGVRLRTALGAEERTRSLYRNRLSRLGLKPLLSGVYGKLERATFALVAAIAL